MPDSADGSDAPDGSVWPHRYWRSWEPIVGITYATTLTKLKAWSNIVTTLLYLAALVILAYYFLVVRNGSLLTATFILLVPWAAVVGIIELQRRKLATTMLRNLAANGKPVSERPTFVDIQFLRWKRDHAVTTDDLQNSAPRSV